MKKTLLTVILLFIIVFSFCSFSYAEAVPNYDDYVKCDIILNGKKIAQPATSVNGNIYIDIDTLKQIGKTDTWEFDTSSLYIWIDASELNLFIADEETTNFIKTNAGTIQIPLKKFNTPYDKTTRYYVSLGSVAKLARLSWYYKEGKAYITQYSAIQDTIAFTSGNENAIKSFTNSDNSKGLYRNEIVTITKETTSFYQVKTGDGNVFYISKNELKPLESTDEIPDFASTGKRKDVFNRPIHCMWSRLKHAPEPTEGLDVLVNISLNSYPKDDGSCKQTMDFGFIQSAQDNGIKVWACAQNGFSTSAKDYISKNLASESARNKTIAQYLLYCAIYNVDGISLDYESMSYTNGHTKDDFLKFVEDLCYYADKMGLTTSVATYYGNSYNNSKMYDFEFLANHCDYLLQMTYGENYVYSLSNMSKNYWQTGMNYIATKAPSEKVILGVAFHMRYTVWDDSGNLLKSSKPKMKDILSDIEKNNIPVTWDEYTGQYYAEEPYESSDGLIKGLGRYYLEEERSSALKAQYIVDNNFGGTIGWEYAYNDNDKVYEAYHSIYNGEKTYSDWLPAVEPTGVEIPKHDSLGRVIINSKPISVDVSEDGNADEVYGE